MPTLIEIAEQEEIVLFHPNVISLDGFGERIFGARKYADLDRGVLQHVLWQLEEFHDFANLRNTFTIKEAIPEFDELVKIIRAKQKYLNEDPGNPIFRCESKTEQERVLSKFYAKGRHKQAMFDEISYVVSGLSNLLNSKTYKPKDKTAYRLFSWKIEDFLKVIRLKPVQEHMQLYVDALYLPLYENKTPALVVMGAEFLDGLSAFLKEISGQSSSFIGTSLQLHPIRLYFQNSGKDFNIVYTTQNEKPTQRINP